MENKLNCLSADNNLLLPAGNGNRLICEATETFKYIDPDFIKLGINKRPNVTAAKILVDVHEVFDNSSFINLFRLLPGAWEQKWLLQSQLIDFCQIWPEWLDKTVYGALFLLKIDENAPIMEKLGDNLAIAYVQSNRDGLHVLMRRPEHGRIWSREHQRLIVIPRITMNN